MMVPQHQPSSMQPAIDIDPIPPIHLHGQQAEPSAQTPPAAASTSNKRKKRAEPTSDEPQSSSEPRRLRRSHEACARCRSKKIKCDSKHPRCTACATAGTACHQEDRHRQTLTPRGHTERIEQQVAQCEALLKRHYPGFELDKLDDILGREGIEVAMPQPTNLNNPNFQFQHTSTPYRSGPPVQQPMPPPGQPGMYYPPPPHMMPPGYGMMPPYGPPFMPMQGPPGSYNPQFPPGFQPPPGYMPMPPPGHPPGPPPPGHPQGPPPPPPGQQQPQGPPMSQAQGPIIAQSGPPVQPPAPPPRTASTTRGQDPNGNDMSNPEALAKNFGVSPAIVNDLRLALANADREDSAIGLVSGRAEGFHPRLPSQWVPVTVRRNSIASSAGTLALQGPASTAPTVEVWLPKDRQTAKLIVDAYFTRLNLHRPVFMRKTFEKILNDLYDGLTISHDPGYICSVYLIFALGTLSELNHRAIKAMEAAGDVSVSLGPSAKKLMPPDWPEHDEFFARALAVESDLRVTLSSLQALILLHWYLYTERQGRTLWRLVGSMIRLSVELGLHHNPRTQINNATGQSTFSEEECRLRINLWGIVLIHDRGTSILLGRPLAISPRDFDTPQPSRPPGMRVSEFSEHFELSNPIAEIQAEIINSLYTPKKLSAETTMWNATRIIRQMREFRNTLAERYHYYFEGTNDWPVEKKSQLVQQITGDEGLTLLKIGIARILLLRALFNSKELSYAQRHRALVDAIITSHNMIIVHNQLIRFPDIAFFTSPIPLHIAAMVILYGHMSKCETLPQALAVQDLSLALDMLPRFRWRWERRDVGGGHPLIAKLAERVMEVDLKQAGAVTHPALLCEPQWDDGTFSPAGTSSQGTPTMTAASYSAGATPSVASGGVMYGPHQQRSSAGTRSSGSTPPKNQLAEVPTQLFYPFYPEYNVPPTNTPNNGVANGPANAGAGGGQQRDYTHLLAAAAQDGTYGCQPSHESFISEERDPHHGFQGTQMAVWMNAEQRGGYPPPPS